MTRYLVYQRIFLKIYLKNLLKAKRKLAKLVWGFISVEPRWKAGVVLSVTHLVIQAVPDFGFAFLNQFWIIEPPDFTSFLPVGICTQTLTNDFDVLIFFRILLQASVKAWSQQTVTFNHNEYSYSSESRSHLILETVVLNSSGQRYNFLTMGGCFKTRYAAILS